MSHYSSFVVRLWVDDCERVTRGYILHVDTQESTYFANADRMLGFMTAHLQRPVFGLPADAGIRIETQIEESSNGQV